MMSRLTLGTPTEYPQEYAPGVLFPVDRATARKELGLGDDLPFQGKDFWNAWELTWLDSSGKPVIATATIVVDAHSPNIIESKSLKLYLNAFAMSRQDSPAALEATISADLSGIAGTAVDVAIITGSATGQTAIGDFPGDCVDMLSIGSSSSAVDAGLLGNENEEIVSEELHSHLLRSLCPVTGQPDFGSVLIRYRGPRIRRASILDYIVSFRQHQDFHEACVERMYMDIKECCGPEDLTVYARYTRRGGLDINPFRSDFESEARNLRLWRQ